LEKRVDHGLVHGFSKTVLVPEVVNDQPRGAAGRVCDGPNRDGEALGTEEAECCLPNLGPGAEVRILPGQLVRALRRG